MSPLSVLVTGAIYMLLLVGVARRAGRSADNNAFFTGSRRNSWWLTASAMIGAAMSGVTLISVPGSVEADGFTYMQMVVGCTVGQLIVALVLVPLFYRLRVVSLYQYLENRFGRRSQLTGAGLFVVAKLVGAGLKIYVVCSVMQLLVFDAFGVPFAANAAATMALVWAYTRRGGVKTLIPTDIMQTVALVGGVVAPLVCLIAALGWSWREAVDEVAASPMARMWEFGDASSPRWFWKMAVSGAFVLVAMTGLDQDMMQRNLSCRTARASKINIVVTAVCQAVVILLLLSLGVVLYRYAELRGIAIPEDRDLLFPTVATRGGLPLVAGVMFVVALVASTWSAAGSALTALTTSCTVDLLHADRFDAERLTKTRQWVHASMAVAMTGILLLLRYCGSGSLINLVFLIAGYTYGPILGLFAFGILTRRRVRDRWVWAVAVASPLICVAIREAALAAGCIVGFEMLIYNSLITIVGLTLISKKR